jgi:uncharacterized protein YkwD
MRKTISLTAAAAALALAVPAAPAHASGPAPSSQATAPAAARAAGAAGEVATMRGLINQARRSAGLPALRPNRVLGRAASLKVGRIASCGQFTHTPCGAPFTAVFRSAGWQRGTMGENIAFGSGSLGTPQAILQSWLQSPGHRANLMSRSFRYQGLAVQTVALPGIGAVRVWVNTFGA